ncbi:hypothetical protein TSUD_251830 [Trifolium subterraneum]|uniref:Uncharacterized protein n=1 Tax=Trifolium subterraneum TaxID=3900 RepID=A0A2Z6MGK0_TRISU|nr:hypothetical protein TSUD_251830 [Trifolium subterraneum]
MSSLSGIYINPNCGHIPPRFMTNPRCSSFSIFLSGRCGKVFYGIVGGTIKAAGVVLIKVVLMKKPYFHRIFNFNGHIHEIEERVEAESNNNNVINVGANVNVMQWN